MPKFRVLRQQDAFVECKALIEADTAKDAVDLGYKRPGDFRWEHAGISEYDACRVVALTDDGEEIESTIRGKF